MKPDRRNYDFNDTFELIRFVKDLERYTESLEKKLNDFPREAFYLGREIARLDENNNPIFKYSTYNQFLREFEE